MPSWTIGTIGTENANCSLQACHVSDRPTRTGRLDKLTFLFLETHISSSLADSKPYEMLTKKTDPLKQNNKPVLHIIVFQSLWNWTQGTTQYKIIVYLRSKILCIWSNILNACKINFNFFMVARFVSQKAKAGIAL